MFSSVEEEHRAYIVEHCYWPLLRLARLYNLPFGIEATACTLELIRDIDPTWIRELSDLIHQGPCEFVGSGYSQLIGPLVPAAVSRSNLRLGMHSYQKILGVQPRIALVNEQAYSSGLVPLYRDAGYESLIMEWDNPFRTHPDWDPDWSFYPQKAIGLGSELINVIWNKSISFQKFQRYAHNQLEIDEYLTFLHRHINHQPRCFPIYGSDAEIFDFRPGRFTTEAPLKEGEWNRIEELIQEILVDPSFSWISPTSVLSHTFPGHSYHILSLESDDQPIPVKKQNKYNILRWAVTGRNDLEINTRCHRLCQSILNSPFATDQDWQELCYLWSSDFRTHITARRWDAYEQRLAVFEKRWPTHDLPVSIPAPTSYKSSTISPNWSRDGRWLIARTEYLEVIFNCSRGLSIDRFVDSRLCSKPLFGTLHHGHFDDIGWGADFYSGHLIFQSPGSHQITDLQPVDPSVHTQGNLLVLSTTIPTPLGPIYKSWTLNPENHSLELRVQFIWPEAGVGCLRLVPFTLFPDAFNTNTLHFSAANGGYKHELFRLQDQSFDHGKPVSFLVSAQHGLGLTDGTFLIGDETKSLRLCFNPSDSALFGQVQHQLINNIWFNRFILSAREVDDTAKHIHGLQLDSKIIISTASGFCLQH